MIILAKGPKYKVPKRRRREGKTNYHKRYKMIRSRKPIFVVRKTNKYIIVQIVYPTPIGDYTLVAAHSRELVKYFGWRAGTKNTPAAYLTGLLAGLRAVKLGISEAIPDIGLHRPVRGAKVFAAIKGAIDAGLKIPCSEEVFPDEDRIKGITIAEYAKMLAESDPEKYNRQFSQLIRNGFDPRLLPQHFEDVKKRILEVYRSIESTNIASEVLQKVVAL